MSSNKQKRRASEPARLDDMIALPDGEVVNFVLMAVCWPEYGIGPQKLRFNEADQCWEHYERRRWWPFYEGSCVADILRVQRALDAAFKKWKRKQKKS